MYNCDIRVEKTRKKKEVYWQVGDEKSYVLMDKKSLNPLNIEDEQKKKRKVLTSRKTC